MLISAIPGSLGLPGMERFMGEASVSEACGLSRIIVAIWENDGYFSKKSAGPALVNGCTGMLWSRPTPLWGQARTKQ